MAQKFWMGVAVAEHIRKGASEGFCAFSHGKRQAIERLKIDDRFIYYATKERYENGESTGNPVQAFLAVGTVKGEVADNFFAGYPAFTRRAEYEPLFHVSVKPLLMTLSFITNPQHWGMAFRRSLFEITERDFQIILDAR